MKVSISSIIKYYLVGIVCLSFSVTSIASGNNTWLYSPIDIMETGSKKRTLNAHKKNINDILQKKEIKEKLMEFGVSSEEAQQRIANLSSEELKIFEAEMNELKAGAGILELTLLVLMIVYFAQRV